MKTFLDRYYRDSVAQGISQGTLLGAAQTLISNVEALMQNLSISLQEACASINTTIEDYQAAKERTSQSGSQPVAISTPKK